MGLNRCSSLQAHVELQNPRNFLFFYEHQKTIVLSVLKRQYPQSTVADLEEGATGAAPPPLPKILSTMFFIFFIRMLKK